MIITEYDEFEAKIGEVQEACNFIPDVSTDEGYAKSKRVALDVGKILTKLEKVRKDKKAFFLEGGKQVDLQAKAIKSKLEEFQLQHKEAYKAVDQAKKDRENARKEALESRVEYMRTLAESMADSHSSEIQCAMQAMNDEECLNFFEFTESALKARNKARAELGELFIKRQKAEQDAIELEKLRKAAEEQAIKDREDAIRKEASEAAERARIEAENRAIKAEKDAKDAIEAAARKAEYEANAKAAEVAKRKADREHVGNIRREAKEAIMSLLDDDNCINEYQAKSIVMAVNNGLIPNVTINY